MKAAYALHGFTFVLPESFEPCRYLPRLLWNRADDARYLVNTILRKFSRREVDETGLVRLKADYLARVMNRSTYATVVQALEHKGVIARFPYTEGRRSHGFAMGKQFLTDRHVRILATDGRLIRKLSAWRAKCHVETLRAMLPTHHRLAVLQEQLGINATEARRVLLQLPVESNPYDSQGVLVEDLEQREYRFAVGTYGRCTNNVTSLKRDLRKSLHVDGASLCSVDVSCAQPAFLAKAFFSQKAPTNGRTGGKEQSKQDKTSRQDNNNYDYEKTHCARDAAQFAELVQTGQFYDFMVEALESEGITRYEFKRRFLADVIAKRKANAAGAEYPSVVEDKFAELFPSVYAFIRKVNRDGREHANLIRLLQREESRFVIETVAADLVERHLGTCFLTLHDAIFSTPEHIPKIVDAFERGFDRTGFRMDLKMEGRAAA